MYQEQIAEEFVTAIRNNSNAKKLIYTNNGISIPMYYARAYIEPNETISIVYEEEFCPTRDYRAKVVIMPHVIAITKELISANAAYLIKTSTDCHQFVIEA